MDRTQSALLAEVEALFHTALELEEPERSDFLSTACRGRPELRQQLETLLAASRSPRSLAGCGAVAGSIFHALGDVEREGSQIGRYRLLERLGEGGCGVVYMAEQIEPVRRRVALKIIKPGMDSRAVIARFEAERQALAMMDHRNIARVFDAGATENGRPYFVMELVRGRRITEYCDHHRLSTRARLKLFVEVCEAVQHAHQKGIIHRDLKPSNILISLDNNVAVPKVIDFGIAKATQERLTDKTLFTQFHQFLGTPAYMSPEQAELTNVDVDTRSDIYSLGVLLYELLTGRTPFDGRELMERGIDFVRRTIREQEAIRPSTRLRALAQAERSTVAERHGTEPVHFESELRSELDWIVMKCLEKDRSRRYDTANALSLDLGNFLDNEPVTARPPSFLYRTRKLVQKHRGLASAAVAVLMALTVGLAGALWQWHHTEQQRQASELNNYIATLGVAEQQIRDGDIFRARDALLAQPKHLRGWEWGRLMAQAHPDLLTLPVFTNEIAAFGLNALVPRHSISDDGALLTIYGDGKARVVRVRDSETIRTFGSSTGRVESAILSPDGTRLLLAGPAAGFAMLDTRSWEIVLTIGGNTNRARRASFSPDGTRLVTCTQEPALSIFDVATGKLLRQLNASGDEPEAVFSSGGDRIYSARIARPQGIAGETQRIWEVSTGALLAQIPPEPERYTHSALSPNAQFFATADTNGVVGWWRIGSTNPDFQTQPFGRQQIFAVFASPTLPRLAALVNPSRLRIWNVSDGSELPTPNGYCYNTALTSDGRWLLSASGERYIRVTNLQYGFEAFRIASGRTFPGVTMSFPRNSRFVVASATDEHFGPAVQVWPLTAPEHHIRDPGWAMRGDISPDGKRVVAAHSFRSALSLWDAETGRRIAYLHGHLRTPGTLVWSPDSTRLYSCSGDRTIRAWDGFSGQQLFVLTNLGPTFDLSLSTDGTKLASTDLRSTLRVWDTRARELLWTIRVATNETSTPLIGRVAFCPSSSLLGLGGKAGGVYDLARRERVFAFPDAEVHTTRVFSLAWSHDGKRLVTMDVNGRMRFWDTGSWRLARSLQAREFAREMQFSPDDSRLFLGVAESSWNYRGNACVDIYDAGSGRFLVSLGKRQGNTVSFGLSADARRALWMLWANEPDGYGGEVWDVLPWKDSDFGPGPGDLATKVAQRARTRLWKRSEQPQPDAPDLPWIEPRDHWPARIAGTPGSCLDLTDAYNAHLETPWEFSNNLDDQFNTLEKVPRGSVNLAGMTWDIRGIIATGRPEPMYLWQPWPAPKGVWGIKVDRKCRFLHFLHAAAHLNNLHARIGCYRLHYKDGTRYDLVLRPGEDLGDWWSVSPHSTATKGGVAWEGDNEAAAAAHSKVRLFRRSWGNPFPEKEISTFDFLPDGTTAVPFLIAVSVE